MKSSAFSPPPRTRAETARLAHQYARDNGVDPIDGYIAVGAGSDCRMLCPLRVGETYHELVYDRVLGWHWATITVEAEEEAFVFDAWDALIERWEASQDR